MAKSTRDRRLQRRREEIGRRLRDAREAQGMSQEELGRKVGCSKSHISQLESATGSYSFRIFMAVCDALEADPAFIFAEVPVRRLTPLYRKFEKAIATLGEEAIDFLLSLEGEEMHLLCQRAVEAVEYQRSVEEGRAKGVPL